MNIFKTIYSKFTAGVVILLILIALNSLFSQIFSPKEKETVAPETQDTEMTDEAPVDENNSEDLLMDLKEADAERKAEAESMEVTPVAYESQEGGENAFELLQSVAEVEYKEYDFGVFVESINGVKGDEAHFWSLYINDEQSQTGADQTTLDLGDKAEWRYEEIK